MPQVWQEHGVRKQNRTDRDGEQMKPTPKLRFVERSQLDYPGANTGRVIRILQQWWQGLGPNAAINYAHPDAYKLRDNPPGEWRDVPIEKESA